MEKYRQFEDESNGINPFIVARKRTVKSAIEKILFIPLFVLGLMKYILFFIIFYLLIFTKIVLNFPILSLVSRNIEVALTKVSSFIMLILLGVYNIDFKFKRHDNKRLPNIIFSSQSTVIDWLILMYNYSPKFLAIVKSDDNKSDYFTEIPFFSLISYSIGIKLPLSKEKLPKFDLENYIEKPSQVPIVIFPECVKTNRFGVLVIRSNLLDKIYEMIKNHPKILLRGEITVNKNGDYNTTDESGYTYLLGMCQRYYTRIEIYSQDILNANLSDSNIEYDKLKYKTITDFYDANLQEYLMEPNHRNCVKLSWKEHKKFLDYYRKTSSDKKATYLKKE